MNHLLNQAAVRLSFVLKTILSLLILSVFFHLYPIVSGGLLHFFEAVYQLFTNNSLMQALLLALVLKLTIADQQRFNALINALVLVLLVATVYVIVQLFKHQNLSENVPNYVFLLVYAGLGGLLWFLNNKAQKTRFGLQYFSPQQFKTLESLAEVCVTGEDNTQMKIPPIDVAHNLDTYMVSFRAKSKWVMKLVLTAMEYYPLLVLCPPLSLMATEKRLAFLKKRFLTDVNFGITPRWLKQYVQAAIRMSKQLCYMGYYSDERVFESIGYVPFSKRKDVEERKTIFPHNNSKASQLKVLTENDLQGNDIEADVVIAGSGAAASMLANRLIQLGRKVLLVERGTLELPQTFNENEVDMVSRLYADGALQLSRDFRFQVFQGSCVGGSTVVNNAVCFKTPQEILDKWTNELGLGLDLPKYDQSMTDVFDMMHIAHTPTMTIDRFLNPGGVIFNEACKIQLSQPPNQYDSVMANIDGCLGCGYCNIGCAYGRKMSMLDTILPETQLAHPNALQILAGCEAISFNKDGKKIVSMTGKFKSGKTVTIKGKTFVASAGAISSSLLLINSKLGIKNAGKKLSFNFGSQITAVFPQTINSYDGLQISHFLKTPNSRFVMETWFNPPMFQSTAMPGWFDQHFNNMRHYANMACTGILVGTASEAEVKKAGLFGRDINFVPNEEDFNSLLDGLETAAEIYLNAGATSVMPNTFNFYEYKTVAELKENFRKHVKSSVDISTGSGHPQGGNVMSTSADTGVVDANCQVFDFDNLFVCDASVFPTSIGVNPQATVMALAHYVAPVIAAN